MNKHLKTWIMAILLACYTTLLIMFIYAYTHGMQVLITINEYGEAQIEILILVFSFPLVLKYVVEMVQSTRGLVR